MTNILESSSENQPEGNTELRKAQLLMLSILKVVDKICQNHKIIYWLDAGTLLGAVRHKGFIPWDNDLDIAMPRADYQKFIQIAADELPENLFLQTKDTATWKDLIGAPPCKIRDKNSKYYTTGKEEITNDANYPSGAFIDIFPIDKFHKTFPGNKKDLLIKWIYRTMCNYKKIEFGKSEGGWKNQIFSTLAVLKPIVRPLFWIKHYEHFLNRKIAKNNQLEKDYQVGYAFDVPWIRIFEVEDIFPLKKIRFEDAEFPAPNNWDSVLKHFYGDYMKLPDEKTIKKYLDSFSIQLQ